MCYFVSKSKFEYIKLHGFFEKKKLHIITS